MGMMGARRLALVMALLCIAAPAAAGALHRFTIGGEAFAPGDIIDARAQPEPDGTASILVTFESVAAERLQRLSVQHKGARLAFTLDGRELIAPVINDPLPGDAMLISGSFKPEEARTIALAIAGKPPLPESLDDEEDAQ